MPSSLIVHIVNSHNTYQTVCNLHAAWKQWQEERRKAGRMDRPPRTPTEAEEDREFEIMRRGDPLKKFQDPQVSRVNPVRTLNTDAFFRHSPAG